MYNFVPLKLNKLKRVFFLVLYVMLGIICTQIKGQGSALKNEPVLHVDSSGTYVTVESGFTAYDLSSYYYGDGENWRWIVLKNPFLQKKGRVWQDINSKKWYCEIFPGEKLYLPSIPNLPKGKISQVVTKENDQVSEFPWRLMAITLIVILFAIIISYLLTKNAKRELNIDPITAGPPQVPGGVNDAGAYTRMSTLAGNNYPGQDLKIKNIRRGTMSGLADVHYADKSIKRINLQNVIGYAGEILVDGKEKTVYFLQGCGNDARNGNYMSGEGISFTPHAEIMENGTAVPIDSSAPSDSKPLVEKLEEEVKVATQKATKTSDLSTATEIRDPNKESNSVQKFLSIVEKMMGKDGENHKVSIKITANGETMEYTAEPRFQNKTNQTEG